MFAPIFYSGAHAFSLYAILLLAISAAAATLALRVLLREEGSRIGWWYFVLGMTIALWLAGRAMSASALNAGVAFLWVRLSYLAEPMLPATLLKFAYIAAGKDRPRHPLSIGSWLLAALIAVLSVTTDFVVAGVWSYPWGFFPRYGPGGIVFMLSVFVSAGLSVNLFVTSVRFLPPGRQRHRLRQFGIGYAIGALSGIDFLCALGIPFMPVGPLAILITVLIVDRTIRRYQLFDITPAFAAKNIVSTIPDGLMVADDEGFIRIVNDALCEFSGFTREQLLTMKVAALVPETDSGDIELRRRGGDTIPVTASRSALEERGRTVGTVIVVRDLRGRRLYEAALREQELLLRTEKVRRTAELQYRTLIEGLSDGIIQIDRDHVIRFVNQAAAQLSGRRPDEVLGKSLFDFFGEDVRNVLLEKGKLRQQAVSDRYQLEIAALDGTKRWVEIMASPVYDGAGEVAGALGIVRDITSRRLFEQQLSASAREWQDTFDAIRMPIVILHSDRTIRRANRAARERASVDATSELAGPVREFGPDDLWQEIDRVAASAEGSARVQFKPLESGEVWDIFVDVVDEPGRSRQIVVSAHEVTTLVELRESLRRSETMSALGELVGGVAHEVRNPLFAISSTLDAFEDIYGRRDEYHAFATTMRTQIERLSGLMSGLLDFGRPASTELTPTNVASLVQEAIILCGEDATLAGVSIEFYPGQSPATLNADPTRLVLAFRNLVHNAIQFAPAGSKVSVRMRQDYGEGENARAIIDFEDEGTGFDPADLPFIFDPFFTRRLGGTGLGLSTTRVIVERLGGTISAGNRPEGGAKLHVELPLHSSLNSREHPSSSG